MTINNGGFSNPGGGTSAGGGERGAQGRDGVKGEKGDKGDVGLTGPTGNTGNTGGVGGKGDTGDTGPKGEVGETGAQGAQGTAGGKGDTGDTGSAGAAGVKGDTGDTGARGAAGADSVVAGPTGQTGERGERGVTGERGAQGLTGETGQTGERGDAGGATGERGAKGDTGDAGPKGDKGDTGARGEAGNNGNQGNEGDVGPAGPTGQQGDHGDQGAPGQQGVRGETGAKGDKGDIGATGEVGAQGEVGAAGGAETAEQIKTKYESNPNTNPFTDEELSKLDRIHSGAQVNVQANWDEDDTSADDYIRNKPDGTGSGGTGETGATGPKGDKGDTGAAGAVGAQGDPGDTGAQGDRGLPGVRGATGEQGTQGVPGVQGGRGSIGEDGAAGVKGDKGDTGAAGVPDATLQAALAAEIVNRTTAESAQRTLNEATHTALRGEIADIVLPDAPADGLNAAQVTAIVKGIVIPSSDAETPLETVPTDRLGDGTVTLAKLAADVGTIGEQGERGEMGEAGSQGAAGGRGAAGAKGDTGEQGVQGVQGAMGNEGVGGDTGERGVAGAQGERGQAGVKGDKGDKGDTGERGEAGSGGGGGTGAKGDKGDKGDTGDAGPTGPRGEPGNNGNQGDRGDTGAAGPKGDKGDHGDQGTQGNQGVRGETGDDGDPGVQGEQGAMGETGATGPKGDRGFRGGRGVAGVGAQGAPGVKGDKGDRGEAGASAAKGDKGDKGDTGAQGERGTAAGELSLVGLPAAQPDNHSDFVFQDITPASNGSFTIRVVAGAGGANTVGWGIRSVLTIGGQTQIVTNTRGDIDKDIPGLVGILINRQGFYEVIMNKTVFPGEQSIGLTFTNDPLELKTILSLTPETLGVTRTTKSYKGSVAVSPTWVSEQLVRTLQIYDTANNLLSPPVEKSEESKVSTLAALRTALHIPRDRGAGRLFMVGSTGEYLSEINRITGNAERVGNALNFGIGEQSPSGLASRGQELFFVGKTTDYLSKLSLETGEATRVGSAVNFRQFNDVATSSLAFCKGVLYMAGVGTSRNSAGVISPADGRLYSVDTETGIANQERYTAGFGVGETKPTGLACYNDELYMVGQDKDALFRLNIETGVATQVGNAIQFGQGLLRPEGLAIVDNTLYLLDGLNDAIYELNPENGIAKLIGDSTAFGIGEVRPTAIAFVEPEETTAGTQANWTGEGKSKILNQPDVVEVIDNVTDVLNADGTLKDANMELFGQLRYARKQNTIFRFARLEGEEVTITSANIGADTGKPNIWGYSFADSGMEVLEQVLYQEGGSINATLPASLIAIGSQCDDTTGECNSFIRVQAEHGTSLGYMEVDGRAYKLTKTIDDRVGNISVNWGDSAFDEYETDSDPLDFHGDNVGAKREIRVVDIDGNKYLATNTGTGIVALDIGDIGDRNTYTDADKRKVLELEDYTLTRAMQEISDTARAESLASSALLTAKPFTYSGGTSVGFANARGGTLRDGNVEGGTLVPDNTRIIMFRIVRTRGQLEIVGENLQQTGGITVNGTVMNWTDLGSGESELVEGLTVRKYFIYAASTPFVVDTTYRISILDRGGQPLTYGTVNGVRLGSNVAADFDSLYNKPVEGDVPHPFLLSRKMPSATDTETLRTASRNNNSALWYVTSDQRAGDNRSAVRFKALNSVSTDINGRVIPTSETTSGSVLLRGGSFVRLLSNTVFLVLSTPVHAMVGLPADAADDTGTIYARIAANRARSSLNPGAVQSSGQLAVSAGVTTTNYAHGLGTVPSVIFIKAVCVSPNNGYITGDIIPLNAFINDTADESGYNIIYANNVSISLDIRSTLNIRQKNSSSFFNLVASGNASDWAYIFSFIA